MVPRSGTAIRFGAAYAGILLALSPALVALPARAVTLDEAPENAGCTVVFTDTKNRRQLFVASLWKEPRQGLTYVKGTVSTNRSGATDSESPWVRVGEGWMTVDIANEIYALASYRPDGNISFVVTIGGQRQSCVFNTP